MRRRYRAWFVLATAGLIGCEIDMGDVRSPLGNDAAPAMWDSGMAMLDPPADDDAPRVSILSAVATDESTAFIQGNALDDSAVVAVTIMSGMSGPYAVAPEVVGFAEWQAEVPIPPNGPVVLTVRGYDRSGQVGEVRRTLDRPALDDGSPPMLTLLRPAPGLETNADTLFVVGNALDPSGLASVTVHLADAEATPGGCDAAPEAPPFMARTANHFRDWSAEVPVPPGRDTLYCVTATDTGGQVARAQVRVRSRAAPPHAAPRLAGSDPSNGETVDRSAITVSLRIESEVEVVDVRAGIVDGPLADAVRDGDAWTVPIRLRPGSNALRVVARDVDNLVGRAVFSLRFDDGWGDGPRLALAPPSPPGGTVTLDLDKQGVLDMFPRDVQRDTTLMYLEPQEMVTNALAVIRDACGPGWDGPGFVPNCPADWGAPEINLWGLLTMTPRSADVGGTSLDGAAQRSVPFLGLPFGEVLGQALGIGYDDIVLPDGPLVEALVSGLIASHREARADGALRVTLEDGLLDMTPLGRRFGPDGAGHPGFIDGEVRAGVLTDAFRMGLTLESNLRLYEGVDLVNTRKDYFADRPEELPVVVLDFETPRTFTLSGIDPNPVVAMDFQMVEDDAFVPPGETLEPIGQGNSPVWDLPRWKLERVVAEASLLAFGELRTGCDLCGPEDPNALRFADPELGSDLAEITIGRVGYDCRLNQPCPNEDLPNPPGVAEHFRKLDRLDCDVDEECEIALGDEYECHNQGRCLRSAEIECDRDRNCDQANGILCLLGQCEAAESFECRENLECGGDEVCHLGQCMQVPAGWFRLWMPRGAAPLPPPAYMWDIVLEVAQARMRDGGVPEGEGDALFSISDVEVGLTDIEIEGLVREQLGAQAETLAESLLGRYVDPDHPVDVFVDRFEDGPWLMTNPCRIARAEPAVECGDVGEAGLYSAPLPAPPEAMLNRLDNPAPSGMRGVPFAVLQGLGADQTLIYVDAQGTRHRLDIVGFDGDVLNVWLREAQ